MVTMFKEEKTKAKRFAESSGRKELREVIGTCEAISERRYNPFFLDAKLGVETLREYFPHWKSFQAHCLDAHALNTLSEVVRLQDTHLKFQSSNLYADPEFVARKIEKMSEKRLAELFLQSWHWQSCNAARKPVNYREFVRRASYQETVRRAHDLRTW